MKKAGRVLSYIISIPLGVGIPATAFAQTGSSVDPRTWAELLFDYGPYAVLVLFVLWVAPKRQTARGQADPWEMMVLLESLKRHWVVSCNGRSRDEKGGINRNKYGVASIRPGVAWFSHGGLPSGSSFRSPK